MIKAIETEYNGYKFRSRIEARWAVFFDVLGIEYEYEKEGFDLNGIGYLPDFWLPDLSTWVEIKGDIPTANELEKCEKLSKYSGNCVFLLSGGIPNDPYSYAYKHHFHTNIMFFPSGGGDAPYLFCECSTCGNIGIQFDGRSDRLNCKKVCPSSFHGDKGYNYDSQRLLYAYNKARSYRFEFL